MLPARILAWYPKAAIGSGVMESLVAHEDGDISQRILKLVRMAASFATACPYGKSCGLFLASASSASKINIKVLKIVIIWQ